MYTDACEGTTQASILSKEKKKPKKTAEKENNGKEI